jgi:hypothetical protein
VAVPTPRHLGELILPLGLIGVDERKRERMEEALGPHLELVEAEPCEAAMAHPHPDLERLVAMGPSAWHADQAAVGERIAALPDPAPVTLSVTVATYRPR